MIDEAAVRSETLENDLKEAYASLALEQVNERVLQRLSIGENTRRYENRLGETQRSINGLVQRIGVLKEELEKIQPVEQN